MSLNKGLNVSLEEAAADGNQIQSVVTRNQSVRPIYEEQLAADGHRRLSSLPDERFKVGDPECSQGRCKCRSW